MRGVIVALSVAAIVAAIAISEEGPGKLTAKPDDAPPNPPHPKVPEQIVVRSMTPFEKVALWRSLEDKTLQVIGETLRVAKERVGEAPKALDEIRRVNVDGKRYVLSLYGASPVMLWYTSAEEMRGSSPDAAVWNLFLEPGEAVAIEALSKVP